MKTYIIINDGNCIFVEAENLKEVYAKTEQPCIDHSKPLNVHQIKAVYNNPLLKLLKSAKAAIGSTLLKLNSHNKETGYTFGVGINAIEEINACTCVLSDLNQTLK